MRLRGFVVSIAVLASFALPGRAWALFHFMEIEQVIGGVAGDTSAQAIQLRQRIANQNQLNGAVRLRAWDAAGLNPVLLLQFNANVANAAACSRILVATPNFEFTSLPPVDATVRNFAMAAIPSSYLAAGSLTFENTAGTLIYWRVSWGGYTGSTLLSTTNDADGNSAPPFAGPLPSSGVDALRFTPACATASTNTAAQYALTAGAATFTNNAVVPINSVVTAPPPVPVFPGSAGLVLIGALGALAIGGGIVRRRLG